MKTAPTRLHCYRAASVTGGAWVDAEGETYEAAERDAVNKLRCKYEQVMLRYRVTRYVAKGQRKEKVTA